MADLMRGLTSLCFLSLFSSILGAIPDVFGDYFNEDVQDVAIPENIALKACLNSTGSSKLIEKINAAKRECFGGDSEFDWNDFADLNAGPDPDNNGMSTKMENAEMCFYENLGWTDGDKVLRAQVFEDFSSIPDGGIKTQFREDVKECYDWNGIFASRKRRSIEEELGEAAEESFAMLPLVRQRRQVVKKTAGKKGPAKKGPAKKGPAKKGSVKKVARKSPAKKGSAKKGPVKKGPAKKGPARKGGKKGGKGPKKAVKGASGQRSSNKGVYNSLWCVDLAVQKYLQTCVENALTRGESWDV